MHNVFDLLDREWARLSVRATAPARRLVEVCRLGNSDIRNLGDLERHVRSADPADADRNLLALVTRVVVDDVRLAARVPLQLLLPGTRNRVGSRTLWDRRHRAEQRLAAAGAAACACA